MNYWIPVIIMGVLLIFAFSAVFIDYSKLIRRLFRNRPDRACIDVWTGSGYDRDIPGWWAKKPDNYGEIWYYKYNGTKYEVRTGHNYPVIFVNGKRWVKARPGFIYALSLGETEVNEKEPQFTEDEIGLQTYGYVMTELQRSIKGKGGSLPWIIIIIVGIIALVGAYMFIQKQSGSGVPTQTQTTTTTTPVPTTPVPIEVQGGN